MTGVCPRPAPLHHCGPQGSAARCHTPAPLLRLHCSIQTVSRRPSGWTGPHPLYKWGAQWTGHDPSPCLLPPAQGAQATGPRAPQCFFDEKVRTKKSVNRIRDLHKKKVCATYSGEKKNTCITPGIPCSLHLPPVVPASHFPSLTAVQPLTPSKRNRTWGTPIL